MGMGQYGGVMRILTLGRDDEGRSCLVDEQEIKTAPIIPGVAVGNLFSTTECPPVAPPPGHGVFDDMSMTPGTVSWMVVDLEPYSSDNDPSLATEMHYNNTIACSRSASVWQLPGNTGIGRSGAVPIGQQAVLVGDPR